MLENPSLINVITHYCNSSGQTLLSWLRRRRDVEGIREGIIEAGVDEECF